MTDLKLEESVVKISAANSIFALKLHLLLSEGKGNVLFSPFSISVAAAMLLRGAKENSAAEIKQVLGFESLELEEEEIHSGFGLLLCMLSESKTAYELEMANAVVYRKDFVVLPEYSSDLQKFYRAATMEADFFTKSDDAVSKINDWVNKNTKGKIPSLFDSLSPETAMVLLNAVYFKGTWENQFNKEITYNDAFYNHGMEDEVKQVPMMYMEEQLYIAEKENYKALELPYIGDNVAMLLFLPSAKNGLPSLEKSLKEGFVTTTREKLFKKRVEVTIPKLQVEYSKELKPLLRLLGINEVFDKAANLKGLSDSDELQVTQVVHKAVLDVNEEGSEAAAVTAIPVANSCSPNFTAEFTADHPFLFVIYHKTNNIVLFMGRIDEL